MGPAIYHTCPVIFYHRTGNAYCMAEVLLISIPWSPTEDRPTIRMQGSPLSGSEGVRVRGTRQQRLVYHVNKALKITFTTLHSLKLRDRRAKQKFFVFRFFCFRFFAMLWSSKKLIVYRLLFLSVD